MAPSSSTSSMMTSIVRPTLAAVSCAAHLLLRRHEAVPALLLHLLGHGAGEGVGGSAVDRLVLEAADAVELAPPSSQSSRSSKSSSVSPGKPTMKVERMARSGQISRQRAQPLQRLLLVRRPAHGLQHARARRAGRGCRDRAGSCPPPSAAARRRRADRDRRSAAAPRRRASPAPAHRSRKRALSGRPFQGLSAYLMSRP